MQLPGNLRPNGGRRPVSLHQAVRRGDRDSVAHARMSAGRGVSALNDRDWEGETALHIATREGHLPIVRLLVESGADIRLATHGGLRPLHIAAMFGHVDIVHYLARRPRGEVNASTEDGRSALHLALKEHHLDAAEALLENGAVTGSTLHEVCFWGFQDIAEWLLGRMALETLAVKDEHNRTPVGRAIDGGHFELAKFLLNKYKTMCSPADVEELKRAQVRVIDGRILVNQTEGGPLKSSCGHHLILRRPRGQSPTSTRRRGTPRSARRRSAPRHAGQGRERRTSSRPRRRWRMRRGRRRGMTWDTARPRPRVKGTRARRRSRRGTRARRRARYVDVASCCCSTRTSM